MMLIDLPTLDGLGDLDGTDASDSTGDPTETG